MSKEIEKRIVSSGRGVELLTVQMTGTGGLAGRAVRQTSLNNHYTPEDVGPGAYVGHTEHKVRPR